MDFTKIKCISNQCKDKHVTMRGAGASFGGRISFSKVRCPECHLTLLLVPMNKELEYEILSTTKEERLEKRIQEAKEKSKLELEQVIASIKQQN